MRWGPGLGCVSPGDVAPSLCLCSSNPNAPSGLSPAPALSASSPAGGLDRLGGVEPQGQNRGQSQPRGDTGQLPPLAGGRTAAEEATRQRPADHVRTGEAITSPSLQPCCLPGHMAMVASQSHRGIDFHGTTVGLAKKLVMCTRDSGGVNQVGPTAWACAGKAAAVPRSALPALYFPERVSPPLVSSFPPPQP